MQKVAGILFFISWLLVGCGIDSIFESLKNSVVFIIALAVTILCAAVLAFEDK